MTSALQPSRRRVHCVSHAQQIAVDGNCAAAADVALMRFPTARSRQVACLHVLCSALLLAASMAVSHATTQTPSEAPPPLSAPSCAVATDMASAAELQAATLTSQRGDSGKVLTLLDEAIAHWGQAARVCKDRSHERAQRNLAESLKLRADLQERLGSAEQCESPQRNARSYQDLAKSAMAGLRFNEAASLFGKAEGQWDLAAERCVGPVRQAAQKMREQSEADGRQAEARARERSGTPMPAALATGPASPSPAVPEVATSAALPPVAVAGPSVVGSEPSAAATVPVAPTASRIATTVSALAGWLAPAAGPAGRSMETRLADGTRVTGQLAWDAAARSFTGNGRFEWTNGDVYEGDVLKGMRHGKGKFTWRDGQVLSGRWENNQAIGLASLRLANGNLFEGTVVNGTPDGNGIMQYASGDRYTGDFRQGMPHGKGTYTWVNTQECECHWIDGMAQGVGRLRFANGNEYKGPLTAGLPNGRGQMSFASGELYQGDFMAGKFDGEGLYRWPNGDEYSGGWKAGVKEGKGVMTWARGDRWEGIYKNDEQSEGQLTRRLKRRPAPTEAASAVSGAVNVNNSPAASAPTR